MFDLQEKQFQKIASLFQDSQELITEEFEQKIKQGIKVLHHSYLWGACKEAEVLIKKNSNTKQNHLFNLIMQLYNKRRDRHQAGFLLLQCFENALRSTMAVIIANALNTKQDDWFLQDSSSHSMQKYLIKKIDKIIELRNKKLQNPLDKTKMFSFDIFDLFSLGDLQYILEKFYSYFESIFKSPKSYKNQELPIFGTKQHTLKAIARIRNARNEIFHNKPTKIKFQNDLEILLLRLGFNLQKACQTQDLRAFVNLKFNYIKVNNE